MLQIQNEWTDPDTTKVKPYLTVKDSCTLYKELLILKDLRVVVPLTLRSEILNILHQGHIGIERTQLSARNTVYWPGISKSITELISNCETCISFRNAQSTEPLLKHEIPDQPWVKIGTDLFLFDNKDYVIAVDYTSKFFEISRLPNTEASTVINHTKAIFSRYGIPRELVSDNGPQFTFYEYKKFSQEWDYKHITSSPRYPKSNGLVERNIQTINRALQKFQRTGDDPQMTRTG